MDLRRLFIVGVSILFTSLAGTGFAQTANWTGPYIGAFGGYGSGTQGQHDTGIPCPAGDTGTPPNCVAPVIPTDGHYNLNGALGGGLIGYNFAFDQFIIGAEGDIAGSGLAGYASNCGLPLAHVCGGDIYAMSDIRARVGLPFGQFMPFIAGGLAVGDIHAYDSLFGVSGTHWEAGWTIGGGIDYKIMTQLSLRLEYLYQDFARQTFFNIVPGVPERVRTDVNIVRAGIVWNFGAAPPPPAPLLAKY
jgi:outer membrane immunogenic protein